MTDRINKLRRESLDTVPTVSSERGALLTEFYTSGQSDGFSTPVQRAKAFYYIMDKKELAFCDGELIVGERGPKAKAPQPTQRYASTQKKTLTCSTADLNAHSK